MNKYLSKEKEKNKVWLLVDSPGIGGAESRAIKVASEISSWVTVSKVVLLVNQTLADEYKKNKELNSIIQDSDFVVCTLESLEKQIPLHSFHKLLVAISLLVNKFLKRIRIKRLLFLKLQSWYYAIKTIPEQDIIHCIFGDSARNGCLFLANEGKRIILIEITSNRLLERVIGEHFKIIFRDLRKYYDLTIRCVSETVYNNSLNILPIVFFKERKIDFGYYSGPFIKLNSELLIKEKKKVIIYGHRFIEQKNPVLFANVIKRLLDNNEINGWKVKFRGKGKLENQIFRILEKYVNKGIVEIGFSYSLSDELAESKIFVSIIITGNYPSNSVFEAMRNGNLLFLSDTGITKQKFKHKDVFFVDLGEDIIYQNLKQAISLSETSEFEEISKSMRDFYNIIVRKKSYLDDVRAIYFSES